MALEGLTTDNVENKYNAMQGTYDGDRESAIRGDDG